MMNDNSCLILLDVGGTYIKSALGEPHAGVIKGTFASTAVSSGGSKEDIANAIVINFPENFKMCIKK